MPKHLPVIEGFHLAVHYETSRFAGGDYYDIIKMPEDQWGFMVADAEDHGTPAAVLMAMTCSLLHFQSGPPTDPGAVLRYIDRTLCKLADPSFATALYSVFDADQRTLRFARAGHPPPMIYRRYENKSVDENYDNGFFRLPNAVSHQCFNFEQLQDMIHQILAGKLGVADGDEPQKMAKQHLSSQDGPLACEKMAEVLASIATEQNNNSRLSLWDRLQRRFIADGYHLYKRLKPKLPGSHNRPEFQKHRYPGIGPNAFKKK